MQTDNLKTLEKMLEMVNTKQTMDNFVKSFEAVLTIFETLKADNASELQRMRLLFENLKKQVESDNATDLEEIRSEVQKAVTAQLKTLNDKIAEIKNGEDGEDGVDGKDADEQAIIASVLSQIPPDVEETAIETRDKLETLKEDERLDKSAIKGIEKIEEDIKAISIRPVGLRGGKGIQLLIGGTKKLLTANTLNLVAGTGITISYAYANGRNDITITATGSASLTPITVTGTINDSNTAFTAASAPNLVIVNGASYRNGHGATIAGTAITLDNPVGNGGDIYAL